LQRLLDVREMREKQAQQELQARRMRVITEQQQLAAMQAREVELRDEQKAPLERGADLHEFAMRRHFLEISIKENVQEQGQQKTRIQNAERAVVEQMDVVKQRGVDVKALEKLREKQREEHRLDQLREEGLFMDDLAGQGFLRRRTQRAVIEAEDNAARIAREEGAAS
jgi:flagellar export protein FliJ